MIPRRLVIVISSGLYTGYVPVASGTVASIVGVGLYLLLAPLNVFSSRFMFYAVTVIALTGVGLVTSDLAERLHGEKDSHKIVIDEIVGYLYAMVLLPTAVWSVAAAFVLFRVFDVWKPFPIRQVQRLPGGIGIMADDVLAGIYTCLLLHILRAIF